MPDGQVNAADNSAPRDWRIALNRANPTGEITSIRQRTWSGLSVIVKEMAFTGRRFEVDRSADFPRLIVVLDEVGDRLHGRDTARQAPPVSDTTQRISYIPAGAPFWTFATRLRYVRYLSLQFDVAELAALVDGDFNADLPQTPRLSFFDPRLVALAHVFEADCLRDGPTDPLFGDGLSITLLSLLKTIDAGTEPRRCRGGLSPRQLKAVTGYVHDHLAERIESHDLAALTGLSAAHFHRAFKASTGLPPHAWLRDRRIARARELMLADSRPLAEIAIETGFFDQAHFTRVFTKAVGTAPATWRRNAMS